MSARERARFDRRVSIHDSVQEMYERIHADGLTSAFDRFDPQARIRCNFCLRV
ncbi:MAG: anaerobic carbon-monoxide dehydrogenase catalytic subunit [Bacillota bacterium]|nr:anaerobic carbon-monoxide dehydrogenase catalytic subunit [Bacillota bacterium]MDK2855222.1 anaerobic carbon-monoxide dehydrogenase catalytic subunit [Bacillota bacterium]MDK2925743.1 anaerobic carbon-monoxide dehydrogenase catalytic subunit [Bacillota bacterium]